MNRTAMMNHVKVQHLWDFTSIWICISIDVQYMIICEYPMNYNSVFESQLVLSPDFVYQLSFQKPSREINGRLRASGTK